MLYINPWHLIFRGWDVLFNDDICHAYTPSRIEYLRVVFKESNRWVPR